MSDRWQTPPPSGSRDGRPRGFDHRTAARDASDDDQDVEHAGVQGIPEALRPWTLRRRVARRGPSVEAPDGEGADADVPQPTPSDAPAGAPSSDVHRPGTPTEVRPGAEAQAQAGPVVGEVVPVRDADARELVAAALSKVTRHSVVVLDRELRVRAAAGHGHEEPPYDEDSLRGRPLFDVLDAEQRGIYAPLFAAALEGATSKQFITSRLGVGRAEVTCGPVREDGAVTGVLMVVRELDPGPAAAPVAESPAVGSGQQSELAGVFDLTFDHSPIAQALVTPDGRWVRANHAACRMLGVREADLVGTRIRDILWPGARETAVGWADRLRAGELDEFALPTRFTRHDGTPVDANIRLAAARDRAGELQGFVAQLIDLAD